MYKNLLRIVSMDRKVLCISLIVALLVFTGCSQTATTTSRIAKVIVHEAKIDGSTGSMLGAQIGSWEVLDANKAVRLSGLSIPLKVFQNAMQSNHLSNVVSFNLPDDVKKTTFVDHIDLQFSPTGFTQDMQEPAFAFRIYSIPFSEEATINCPDPETVTGALIPTGYESVPSGSCIPQLGTRIAAQELQQDPDHPTPFARINFGYSKGNMIFIEPVVTVAKFLQDESFTLYIPTPTMLIHNILFPTTFTGVYEPDTNSYNLSIWEYEDLSTPAS